MGELGLPLRRAARGYVLGVNATHNVHSWSRKLPAPGTAESSSQALGALAWQHLTAGQGTNGPRFDDWACLEVTNLHASDLNEALTGTLIRGRMIRRSLTDNECTLFTTCCPAGTALGKLITVEGYCRAIEDSFKTTMDEFRVD